MSIMVEVYGDYAAFNRPELKVERMTYDVITPSAARGILDAILWHPGMRWVVDKIYVLSPIQYANIRRNEVKSKISARNVRTVMNGKKNDLYIDYCLFLNPFYVFLFVIIFVESHLTSDCF